jgi:hypothetical protein
VQIGLQFQDSNGAWSPREAGMFGIHFVNTTSNALDVTWTDTDFGAVEASLMGALIAIAPKCPSDVLFYQFRWYAYGPGITAPNPPVRITNLTTPIQGTTGPGAHQVGGNITLETGLRRHWGRFNLPVTNLYRNAGGQMDVGDLDVLLGTWHDVFDTIFTASGILPVVWDRQRHSAFGVTAVRMDSTPDIQRRRRTRSSHVRKSLPLPTG